MNIRLTEKIADRVTRTLRKNFHLAFRMDYRRYRARQDPHHDPLIVFQMGKVGSSTLAHTLKQLKIPRPPVYQVHVLSDQWITRVYRMFQSASRVHGRAITDEDLLASCYLRERIRAAGNKRWKVITLIRDPIARNVSAFFEAFPIYYPEVAQRFNASTMPIEEKVQQMIRLFLGDSDKHDVPIGWDSSFGLVDTLS